MTDERPNPDEDADPPEQQGGGGESDAPESARAADPPEQQGGGGPDQILPLPIRTTSPKCTF